MTDGGYDAFDDPYCYRGTFVLKNKAGLRDASALEGFELEMSAIRAEEPLPHGRFDPRHYRAVHRHLFQDVYRWAGRYRTIRTTKDGNPFCYPEYIEPEMDALFARLREAILEPMLPFPDFTRASAEFLGELNAIHPFRDGNGRTQLSFLFLLALEAGHPLDLARVDRTSLLPAMIASFHGQLGPLEQVIAGLGA
jgi:cell filamentation protein